MKPILLDSTDPEAITELVMSLIQNKSTEYTVLNERQEDITHEIKQLVSLKSRMLRGR
jgi:hypothetical protein